MFSIPYFKQTFKSNFKFLAAFTAVVCMFLIVISYIFTPQAMAGIEAATADTAVSNILNGNGSLVSFMSNSFYVLMAIIFPMVYEIMAGNRMIAEKVDKGSMAGFLSAPITRNHITVTSALYFILSLIIMWSITSIAGIAAAEHFQPDALDIKIFLLLNAGACLYHFVISGICFCSSCIFNTSKMSLTFGAGIPLFFFVVNTLMKLSSDLDFLKYFTLNTLFDTQAILEGSGYGGDFIIMAAAGIILYLTGIVWFSKKDLPL